jgi:hypothetical protein
MAKLNFALLCSRAIVDKATNQFSAIDVIEQITINVPPETAGDASPVFVMQNPAQLVVDISRSQLGTPETARVRVNVLCARGERIGGAELDLDMQTTTRCRGFITISGLPISSAGALNFEVQILDSVDNWLTVTQVLLPVNLVPSG